MSQLTGFQHLFNMISENQYHIFVLCTNGFQVEAWVRESQFRAAIRHKMYQLESKELTLTKIPN